LLEPESTSESEDFHTAVDNSDTNDSDSDFELEPQAFSVEEKKNLTDIIHQTYDGWWDSKFKDLSPEIVMYAFLALTDVLRRMKKRW
jgi:hypothetical protein